VKNITKYNLIKIIRFCKAVFIQYSQEGIIKKQILQSLSDEQEYKEREVKKLKQKVKSKIEELEKEGDIEMVIQYLENKMFMAAKELRFEDAAYLRDKIKSIRKTYKISSS